LIGLPSRHITALFAFDNMLARWTICAVIGHCDR
jgi:hypothetical protein